MNARAEHLTTTKTARVYSLGDARDQHDLWIVCHGYGQLAARFIKEFEPIAVSGRLIVAPEGLHRFYLDPPPAPAAQRRVGATWMTREDRATDITDYVAYLDRVAQHYAPENNGRVRAFGFSQGAATVFRWAVLGRTQVAELILWAGEVPPDVDMTLAADRLRNTRIVFAHGTADQLVARSVVERHLALLDSAGLSYELREYPGAHSLDSALLTDLASI